MSKNKQAASAVGDAVRKTLNLPKTDFPMRANATVREPQLHARTVTELYATQERERKGVAPTFLLHDGPPFANGSLHTGHFLNRVLKDIINRYKLQRGYHVHYVPGWDCHGLPIEIKALERLKQPRDKLNPLDIRKHSRQLALEAIEMQKSDLQQWGILADWSGEKGTRYLTMDPEYEVAQYDIFKKMVKDGLIVQGYKPVYWSPSSGTALAESELEYQDNHISTSAYVRFPVKNSPLLAAYPNASAVIWTTTPWTIPANRALCVRSDLEYAILQVADDAFDVVASALVDTYAKTVLGKDEVKVVATISGRDLVGSVFQHPLTGHDSIVLLGDHVTTETGTGIVHTAPAHGQEDYFAWMNHHSQHNTDASMTCLVDEKGCYTSEAGESLQGLFVQKEGNDKVLDQLTQANRLVSATPYSHRFPYDWRTKKPILLRATKQWFAKLDSLHALGHTALESVQMHPKASRRRLEATLSSRSEWCISRQRAWGVPIPVFYHKDTGEPLLTEDSISHVQQVMLQNGGTDAWWTEPLSSLLPRGYDANDYVKGTDTLDVWFDSGSSWYAVLPENATADIYLEGSDQHRGWFQSSLLTALAVKKQAPYHNIITHGFILDERGQKMSKSLGNVIAPHEIINGQPKKKIPAYGVDTLRYWVASTDYTSQVTMGPSTMVKISDHVRKVRNTARFLLANLHDFDPRTDMAPYEQMASSLDKYMLHLIHNLQADITQGYETFAFNKVQQALAHFIATDLSAFYMEACKDRLYCDATNDPSRRSAQTVLEHALRTINKAIAPVVCHTAEDIRMHRLAQYTRDLVNDVPGSIFMEGWFESQPEWRNADVASTWEIMRSLRLQVNRSVEQLREQGEIKTTMECNLDIHAGAELMEFLRQVDSRTLEDMLLSSGVNLHVLNDQTEPTHVVADKYPVAVYVRPAVGHKCPRCWKFAAEVNQAQETFCTRCAQAVGSSSILDLE